MKQRMTPSVALLLIPAIAGAAGHPSIVDLGPTTVFDVTGYSALNDRGKLVGYVISANSHSQAAEYSDGEITEFGTLGGDFSYANGIDNVGRIIGYSYLPGNVNYHAALFTKHGPKDLGTLGGSNSVAYALNREGQIAGLSTLVPGDANVHAAFFSPFHAPIDLGTLGGSKSAALGINNHGIAVGIATVSGDAALHAALFKQTTSPLDLGTLGGTLSWASAINDHDVVIGYSTLANESTSHAALFTPGGSPIDLGTLGGPASQAYAINDEGYVVGFADTEAGQSHGALWRNIGGTWTVTDFNSLVDPKSGWIIDDAYSINNCGLVESVGHKVDNVEHTLLLDIGRHQQGPADCGKPAKD
jgi:probable HAF family extracellular repeat protein